MTRGLRVVTTERPAGSLTVDQDGTPHFEGAADGVLRSQRHREGDKVIAQQIMRDGWSNGYLYFAEPTP